MKNVVIALFVLVSFQNVFASENPFSKLYARDVFTPELMVYSIDGLVFDIDSNSQTKKSMLATFTDKCLNTIPAKQNELLKNLENHFAGFQSKQFVMTTKVVKSGGYIGSQRLADYECQITVKQQPDIKYYFTVVRSNLYSGKNAEINCQNEIKNIKSNALDLGLFSVYYNAEYAKSGSSYKPSYGQVTFVKLKKNPKFN